VQGTNGMTGRIFMVAVAMVALGSSGYAQARLTCAVVPKSLAVMKDCYRPLLVFSPSGDDARLRRQVATLDGAADDMMDRFVLYTPIVPDGRQVTTPADSPYTILSAAEMKDVRARFHIPAGQFAVMLLDEDGSVMLRGAGPLAADRLNAAIDKTPRRQAEAQRPHAN
jgi:hypothetical protein